MTLNTNHPARSHAFLSRLHDGELAPGERAHFEAHRAHCKECRDAAADFERALALFRSSRSSAPPSDLALRVLRKVQTHASSRRTPFGDLFSVDLRWAGGFAVALLVLLIATPVLLQQQKRAAPADTPIPVALQSRENQPSDKLAGASGGAVPESATASNGASAVRGEQFRARAPQAKKDAPLRDEARSSWNDDGATVKDAKLEGKVAANATASAKPEFAQKAQAQAPAAAPAPPSAPADADRAPNNNVNRQLAAAPAPQAVAPDPQGGEGARDQASMREAAALDRPARLTVQPLDALGSPPELDARFQSTGLNELRGRSYVVLVDGQGRVTEARETASKKLEGAEEKRRDSALAKDREKEKDNAASASAALKTLRFKPTERQRRLLVRVE